MNAIKLPQWKHLSRGVHQFCLRLFKRRCAKPTPLQAAPETLEINPVLDDGPRGCGWFDSSHDLQHGLRVQEHLHADTLARELPLGAWLDLQLSGWREAGIMQAGSR